MAGMAFANAFLGVCHSMAHKLGGEFHVPHGLANALLISYVIRFNATEKPVKQGTFPQYDHPHAKERYAQVADYLGLGGKTADDKVENGRYLNTRRAASSAMPSVNSVARTDTRASRA